MEFPSAVELLRSSSLGLIIFGNCANSFSGIQGVLVDLKDTIRSFKAIMNGDGDDLPEGAFYMVYV